MRQLGAWAPADADASRQDLAERLGQWLSLADVIALQAAHQSIRALDATRPAAAATDVDVRDAARRVRTTLARAIEADTVASEPDAGYAHYHQRYLGHQRRMATAIATVRESVRGALAQASPRLARLAALDAVLEQMFGTREHRLLATVPAFLRERCEHLQASAADAWQPVFAHEFRQALLAELELRLQPVAGMIDALSKDD